MLTLHGLVVRPVLTYPKTGQHKPPSPPPPKKHPTHTHKTHTHHHHHHYHPTPPPPTQTPTREKITHSLSHHPGEPNNAKATTGIATHCSAFVASVCERLGIYVLRPPEHSQVMPLQHTCWYLHGCDLHPIVVAAPSFSVLSSRF